MTGTSTNTASTMTTDDSNHHNGDYKIPRKEPGKTSHQSGGDGNLEEEEDHPSPPPVVLANAGDDDEKSPHGNAAAEPSPVRDGQRPSPPGSAATPRGTCRIDRCGGDAADADGTSPSKNPPPFVAEGFLSPQARDVLLLIPRSAVCASSAGAAVSVDLEEAVEFYDDQRRLEELRCGRKHLVCWPGNVHFEEIVDGRASSAEPPPSGSYDGEEGWRKLLESAKVIVDRVVAAGAGGDGSGGGRFFLLIPDRPPLGDDGKEINEGDGIAIGNGNGGEEKGGDAQATAAASSSPPAAAAAAQPPPAASSPVPFRAFPVERDDSRLKEFVARLVYARWRRRSEKREAQEQQQQQQVVVEKDDTAGAAKGAKGPSTRAEAATEEAAVAVVQASSLRAVSSESEVSLASSSLRTMTSELGGVANEPLSKTEAAAEKKPSETNRVADTSGGAEHFDSPPSPSPFEGTRNLYLHALYMHREYTTSDVAASTAVQAPVVTPPPMIRAYTTSAKKKWSPHRLRLVDASSSSSSKKAKIPPIDPFYIPPQLQLNHQVKDRCCRRDFVYPADDASAVFAVTAAQRPATKRNFSLTKEHSSDDCQSDGSGSDDDDSRYDCLLRRAKPPYPTKRVKKTVEVKKAASGGGNSSTSRIAKVAQTVVASYHNHRHPTTVHGDNDYVRQRAHAEHVAKIQKKRAIATARLESKMPRGITVRPSGKWQAQIYFLGKSRYLGVFKNSNDAAIAYESACLYLKQKKKEAKLQGGRVPDGDATFAEARRIASDAVGRASPE